MKQIMKLEVKHLAPYLPYGLTWQVVPFNGITYDEPQVEVMFSISYYDPYVVLENSDDYYLESDENDNICKPILRPLSCLTKEIKHNGGFINPMRELFIDVFGGLGDGGGTGFGNSVEYSNSIQKLSFCYNQVLASKPLHFNAYEMNPDGDGEWNPRINQLELFQKLFEWHFDVFGLIEQGLAIDINTLSENN